MVLIHQGSPWALASYQTDGPTMKTTDLEHLKPSNPSKHASSMRGDIIFSIISVMTVKVGSTMKSMNPVGIAVFNLYIINRHICQQRKATLTLTTYLHLTNLGLGYHC